MPRHTLAALAILTPLAFAACTPQARYPAIEGDVATESLNVLPSPLVMRLALQRVADRHLTSSGIGQAGAYDILLPEDVSDRVASDIARQLGDEVYVTNTLHQDVPVLAIRRVIVLGDTATVDVERPVPAAGARQLITVRLRSSIRGWRVEGLRSWPVGLEIAPVRPTDDAPTLEMDTEPVAPATDDEA